jgi:hypothetical protein
MPPIESGQTEDHISAHKRSSIHQQQLLSAEFCGCFHCCEIYSPTLIDEWVDEDEQGIGQTAMCPKCGIDSVIAVVEDSSEVGKFLRTMRQHWF